MKSLHSTVLLVIAGCPWTSRHSRTHLAGNDSVSGISDRRRRPLGTLSVKARMFVQDSVCEMNLFAKPDISCLVALVTANH